MEDQWYLAGRLDPGGRSVVSCWPFRPWWKISEQTDDSVVNKTRALSGV